MVRRPSSWGHTSRYTCIAVSMYGVRHVLAVSESLAPKERGRSTLTVLHFAVCAEAHTRPVGDCSPDMRHHDSPQRHSTVRLVRLTMTDQGCRTHSS